MSRSLFDVYDEGREIGVLVRESAYRFRHLPISFQGSIEDTYTLAKLTCEVLQAFFNADRKFPECLEQFVEEESGFTKDREEYLTTSDCSYSMGAARHAVNAVFLQNETCKTTRIPGAKVGPDDPACCIGIRKEQQ